MSIEYKLGDYIRFDASYNIINVSEHLSSCRDLLEEMDFSNYLDNVQFNLPISVEIDGKKWKILHLEDSTYWLFYIQSSLPTAPTISVFEIIKHIPCFIFWKDKDFVYRGCNQRFAEAAGISSTAEIIGKTDFQLPWASTEAEQFRLDDEYILAGNSKLDYEETQLQASGETRHVLASKAPYYDEYGEVAGLIGVYSDITKQINALENTKIAKADAEKSSRAKTDFIAVASHEMRTPLNALLGISELLSDRDFLPEDTQDIDMIYRSAKHLTNIVSDLLDYTLYQKNKFVIAREKFSLKSLRAEMKHYFSKSGSNIAFEIGQDLDFDSIVSDETKIKQIMINLIGNAFKFTEVGKITLYLRTFKNLEGDALRIVVSDTGIGMTKDELKIIYEKFTQLDDPYRRKQGGLGLGLAITHDIIKALEGTITVSSEPNKGTTFTVQIPVNNKQTQMKVQEKLVQEKNSTSKPPKILVVEDNKINQHVAKKFFGRFTQDIHICDDGGSALESIANNRYDMVFLDISLPDMKGTEIALKLRSISSYVDTPVIAVTANATKHEEEEYLACGMNDVIFKPLTTENVDRVFKRWSNV